VLTISNLSKAYRGQRILDGVNWFASDRTRIGLTGMNGAGKSTLLKLIAGQVEADSGEINLPKGTTVGYLPQEGIGVSGRTVFDEALSAFADVHALEAECRRLEEELGAAPVEGPEHDRLMTDHFSRSLGSHAVCVSAEGEHRWSGERIWRDARSRGGAAPG